MLGKLPYLSLSEAAEYCSCSPKQLLRLAERGPEYLELLYDVDYEDMGFGPNSISVNTGDTSHFLVIPCTHIKELILKGQTAVQVFLVAQSAGRTANMLDILQRLSLRSEHGSVKEIRCRSEWLVKTEDLYIMRESLDRICHDSDAPPTPPTYLTLDEASRIYGKTVNRILMEAAKGVEHLELLYWVQYKDMHRDYEFRQFEGPSVAGDYLVVPRERVVELRHQDRTATDCFYFPTRSPMHPSMVELRNEKRFFGGQHPEGGPEFVRCETILIIGVEDENLVVMAGDLDRLWPASRSNANNRSDQTADVPASLSEDEKQIIYPTELRVAIEAQEEFIADEGATKSLSVIKKWVKKCLVEKGIEAVEHHTCKRIAQLITCNEVSAALESWEAVYGQSKGASRGDMERHLAEKRGLNPNSNVFKRILSVTTPDRKKKYKSKRH